MNEELDNTKSEEFPEDVENAMKELDISMIALIKELADFRYGESKEGDSMFPDHASELAEKFIRANKELTRVVKASTETIRSQVYDIVYYWADGVWREARKYFREYYPVDITLDTIRSQAFIAVPGHTAVGPPIGRPDQEQFDEVKEKFGYVERTGCPRF